MSSPPWGAPFSLLFKMSNKYIQNIKKKTVSQNLRQNDPPRASPRTQNGSHNFALSGGGNLAGGVVESSCRALLKSVQNSMKFRHASWHPICTPGRPKRSIVATWPPKMLPKWSPKRSQVDNCRPLRNIRRRERIACPAPLGSSSFAPFSEVEKIHPQISEKNTFHKTCAKTTPKGLLRGP